MNTLFQRLRDGSVSADEIDRIEEVVKCAAATVNCCNVWGKVCRVEDLRKALCALAGQEYAPPSFAPPPPQEEKCFDCYASFIPKEEGDMYCPKCAETYFHQCGCRGICLCYTRE